MNSLNFSKTAIFVFATCFLFQCEMESDPAHPAEEKEERESANEYTRQEGKIVALVDNSISSYFIYKGEPKGFEFEMLSRFAKSKNLTLEIKIIESVDHILDSLREGKGDLAAANLTISKTRLNQQNFSIPLFRTRQVLVQRLPENFRNLTAMEIDKRLIRDPLDLYDKKVMVRKNSSYYKRLINFSEETDTRINIIEASPYMTTENLISMVSKGEIDYTICDENIAKFLLNNFRNIDVKTPLSLSQNIGWAVRKEATQLLDSINDWIDREKGKFEYNVIFNSYFEPGSKTRMEVRKSYDDIKKGRISEFDEVIQQYAKEINWDWKLLAALVNKESNFNAEAQSWVGARGLMQLMPRIASSYGIDTNQLYVPEVNVIAGTKHLQWLQKQWETVIPDSAEAIKFTLASYNVGFGHVSDARRIAKSIGMNPEKWDGSVEQMLLLKSNPEYYTRPEVRYGYCRGVEPVNYVKDIMEYYLFYQEFESSPPLLLATKNEVNP